MNTQKQRRQQKRRLIFYLVLIGSLCIPISAWSTAYEWDCTTNGNWNDASCWDYGSVPDSNGYVYVGNVPSSTVKTTATIDSTATAHDLYVDNTGPYPVSVDLIDGGSLQAVDEYFGHYTTGSGSITQSGGTNSVSDSLYLGYETDTSGTYTMTGGALDVTNGIYVGGSSSGSGGKGVLTVSSGKVTTGSLTVWNSNSSIETGNTTSTTGGYIDITGALALTGGGTATSYYGIVDDVHLTNLGYSLIQAQSAFSSGSGSLWNTHDLYVGYTGSGSVGVSTGGEVKGTNVFLGFAAGSTGSVSVSGLNALFSASHMYIGGTSSAASGGKGSLVVGLGGTATADSLTVWNGNSSIYTGNTVSPSGGAIDISGALTLTGGGQATGYYGIVDDGTSSLIDMIQAQSASISGTGSLWNTGEFYVGNKGSGSATIASGGGVKSSGNTYVGYQNGSNGTLEVDAGGTVDTGGNGFLGYASGATGSATVGGSNARWNVTDGLYVGGTSSASGGAGTLTVNSGGLVTANSLTVWNGNSSIATGSNSSSTGGLIYVTGTLTLAGGGTATSSSGYIDNKSTNASSSNNITVRNASISGTGSLWDSYQFYSGYYGSGTVTVSNGGEFKSEHNTFLGYYNGSTGTLNIDAGGKVVTGNNGVVGYNSGATGAITVGGSNALWSVTNGLYIGGSSSSSGGTGTLTVNSGGTVTAKNLTVWNGNSSITTGDITTTTGGYIDIKGALSLTGGGTATSYSGDVDTGGGLVAGTPTNDITAYSASVSGTGSLWDTAYFTVGDLGSGTATISDGGVVKSSQNTDIGANSGSTGAVTVSGTGAKLSVTKNLYVGGSSSGSGGTGTLTASDGGTVTAANLKVWNGNSSITSGTTSSVTGGLIDVAGTLTLTGGGKATDYNGVVGTNLIIGASTNTIVASAAVISGTGSLWDSNTFYDSFAHSGTATVSNGGVLKSESNTFIGVHNGSMGTLNIDAGGKVVTGASAVLGNDSGATGTVTVGGSNALWNVTAVLSIGGSATNNGGTGTLTVNSGGTVTADKLTVWNGSSTISTGTSSSGSGGAIDVASTLTLQDGGTATSYYGMVDSNSANSHITNLIHAGSATISGTGSLWDTGYFYSGLSGSGATTVENGGEVKSAYSTYVGYNSGSTGSLNINTDSTVVTGDQGNVGYNLGSTGTVTVDGSGDTGSNALWSVTNGLYIGGEYFGSGGKGTLTVNTGGKVTAGSLTVWNGNSSISTGDTSSNTGGVINVAGALNLFGGSTATSYFGFVDSASSGATNIIHAESATISGTGTSWDTGNFIAGFKGSGTVTVSDGGTVQSVQHTAIGQNDGSTGFLNIKTGGTVNTKGQGDIGYYSGATGTVTVGGTNALWNVTHGLYVGGSSKGSGGTGTLNVNDGGTVNAGTVKVWDSGVVNMDGGFMFTGTLDLSTSGSQFNFTGGTLAADTVIGNLLNQGGTVAPGHSPGVTHVTGDYTQGAAATLAIQIGGLTPGTEYDVLNVDGTANLGGTLDVSWYDMGSGLFSASLGDTFNILSASSIVGTFSSLSLATLDPGLAWNVNYLNNPTGTDYVQLAVVSAAPAPEPPTAWLFATGLIGLIDMFRRRRV